MCGIVGIVWADPNRLGGAESLRDGLDAIVHRGPDGEGLLVQPGICAGMRRLSIIDIEGGQQPIFNETGTVGVLFNGEIYNFVELRRELVARGHTFRTRSDTEVIVHMYEEFGSSFVERLDGMFAFVVWDAAEKRAFLARDRFGIKPLHLVTTREGLAFASEIKALVAAGWVEPRLERSTLPAYVRFGWVPDYLSLWEGVRRLAPGHTLEVVGGVEREPQRYHRHRIGGARPRTTAEIDEELEILLRAAVARQLVADVPVGVFLSGGIDSSLLVAAAASGRTDLPCHTIDFERAPNTDLGESDVGYARLVADTFGLNLTVHRLESNATELLPQMMRTLDEPSGDPAVLNAFLLARAARPFTKVLLSGMGADEVAGGYRRHSAAYWGSPLYRIPHRQRTVIASAARRWSTRLAIPLLSENPFVRRVRKGLGRLPIDYQDVPESFAVWIDAELTRSLGLQDEFDAWLHVVEALDGSPTNPLEACLGFDVTTYLASHNLFYTDKATMAASVEVRVPYLDNALSEFLMDLPIDQKVTLTSTKVALRRAAHRLLPRAVSRRRKTGFGVPIRSWLRGDDLRAMMNDLLSEDVVRRRGLFDPAGVRTLVDLFDRRVADVAYPIWHLLALEIWCREMLDRKPERAARHEGGTATLGSVAAR
jgi:asparagine synthase (glutamine-hydrolysing)